MFCGFFKYNFYEPGNSFLWHRLLCHSLERSEKNEQKAKNNPNIYSALLYLPLILMVYSKCSANKS